MGNKKRRDALKKLLEARKIFYSNIKGNEENDFDEPCRAYYEKYVKPIDDAKTHQQYLRLQEQFEKDAPQPPKGYDEWIDFRNSAFQIQLEYDYIIYNILGELQEPTLEDVVEKFPDQPVSLSDAGLSELFETISDIESPELMKIASILREMKYDDWLEIDVISILGEAYGKLGIPVEELPEIGIQDTIFLKGYLYNFPKNEHTIIKEGAPEYGQYMELFNLVQRAQGELDLKNQKKEQDDLNGRTRKIAEAEALVYMQQGQQQE